MKKLLHWLEKDTLETLRIPANLIGRAFRFESLATGRPGREGVKIVMGKISGFSMTLGIYNEVRVKIFIESPNPNNSYIERRYCAEQEGENEWYYIEEVKGVPIEIKGEAIIQLSLYERFKYYRLDKKYRNQGHVQ